MIHAHHKHTQGNTVNSVDNAVNSVVLDSTFILVLTVYVIILRAHLHHGGAEVEYEPVQGVEHGVQVEQYEHADWWRAGRGAETIVEEGVETVVTEHSTCGGMNVGIYLNCS